MAGEKMVVIKDILDSFRSRPGRLLLSYLAITVGMISLCVLLAVLGGLNQRAADLAGELGVRVIALLRDQDPDARQKTELSITHADYLAANLVGCTISAARHYQVKVDLNDEAVQVTATDQYYDDVKGLELFSGRFIDHTDMALKQRHAVVSRALADTYRWDLGKTISLQGFPFTVVGIAAIDAGPDDQEEAAQRIALGEKVIFVPSSLKPYWMGRNEKPSDRVDAIGIKVPVDVSYEGTLHRARDLLDQPDMNPGPVSWVTPDKLVEGIRKIQTTIQLTAGSIALLCLVLGGTTLMSLMVANVRDRITEIGLRRALGATRSDIALLFVLEGCLITAAAAGSGALLSAVFLTAASNRLPVPVNLGPVSMLTPLGAALVLGIAFSYWPARSAARISPADALRND